MSSASPATNADTNNNDGGGFGWQLVSLVNRFAVTSFTPATGEENQEEEEDGSCKIRGDVDVGLTEVPETMLGTLHNRAGEVLKGNFEDDKCLEIYKAIDYDYVKSFGPSEESHAVRSYFFDQLILDFWKANPEGSTIINLGEGLETQRFRLEEDRKKYNSLFLTVDLPSAVAAREKFIQPDEVHLHVAVSAMDVETWARAIPAENKNKPVFITAQGLIMYFEPEDNATFFADMAKHFPGSTIAFDFLAKFVSDKTLQGGWKKTPHYTTPRMPTGANRFDCEALFQSWVPNCKVEYLMWPWWKSSSFFIRNVVPIMLRTPVIRTYQPGMAWAVTFPAEP